MNALHKVPRALRLVRSLALEATRVDLSQRRRFAAAAAAFPAVLGSIRHLGRQDFTTPLWSPTINTLERDFRAGPSFDFLRHGVVRRMMFVTAGGEWLKAQLAGLDAGPWRVRLGELLREDWAGRPLLQVPRFRTSHNRVHHLHHWQCFVEATGCEIADSGHVVEWGGGYGDMARLFRRLARPGATYTIIDLPLMTCLQWVYLVAVLGPEGVALSTDGEVVNGAVNLVPVGLADCVGGGDIFVSTWALDESSKAARDYVEERSWFGARHLLLAYAGADSGGADLDARAARAGAMPHGIEFLPAGNGYAFR